MELHLRKKMKKNGSVLLISTFILAIKMFTPSAAYAANSCANLSVIGTYDQSGLTENDFGIYAVGTFRIEGEPDENQQPNFNLTEVNCRNSRDGSNAVYCDVAKAITWADDKAPNVDFPNCNLDIDTSDFIMKEISKGILSGTDAGNPSADTTCFNTNLVIDKRLKKVYLNFIRTNFADEIEKTMPNMCKARRTQVLMNCTGWARGRASAKTDQRLPARYCDFSKAGDK